MDSNQIIFLSTTCAICMTVAWIVLFLTLRKQPEVLLALFNGGQILRLMTVMFIVTAITVLAMGGLFTQDLATIFAGIAGYVLGGVQRNKGARAQANNGSAKAG